VIYAACPGGQGCARTRMVAPRYCHRHARKIRDAPDKSELDVAPFRVASHLRDDPTHDVWAAGCDGRFKGQNSKAAAEANIELPLTGRLDVPELAPYAIRARAHEWQ